MGDTHTHIYQRNILEEINISKPINKEKWKNINQIVKKIPKNSDMIHFCGCEARISNC